MPAEKSEWAVRLAQALSDWCLANRYVPKNTLSKELGIEQEWVHISSGAAIVGNVEAYALLYLKTGLREADPRTLPSRVVFKPRTKQYGSLARAWTEEDFAKWLRKKSQQEIPTPPSSATTAKEGRTDVTVNASGSAFDQAMEAIADAIATRVARLIQDKLETIATAANQQLPREGRHSHNPKALTQKLTNTLRRLAESTPEERDAFVEEYGMALGELAPLLEAMTLAPQERERKLETMRRFQL